MSKTIQEAVAEKIIGSAEIIRDTVIDQLAKVEISRRVNLINQGIIKQDELEKELKKINRPDLVTYNGQGEKQESTSKARYDEITKVKEKLERIDSLVSNALSQNTGDAFNKLDEGLKKL